MMAIINHTLQMSLVWLMFMFPVTLTLQCYQSTCTFELDVRWARTMTYRATNGQAYNVNLNGTDLITVTNSYTRSDDVMLGVSVSPDDVHTADGYPRNKSRSTANSPALC